MAAVVSVFFVVAVRAPAAIEALALFVLFLACIGIALAGGNQDARVRIDEDGIVAQPFLGSKRRSPW